MNDEGVFRGGVPLPRHESRTIERTHDWTSDDERNSVPHVLYHLQPIAREATSIPEYQWCRGMEIPNYVRDGRYVHQTYAHTNWPRMNGQGLPPGWKMQVERVAAICDRAALDHAEWFEDVSVSWEVESKPFVELTLAELVFGGRAVGQTLLQQCAVQCRLDLTFARAPADMRFWMRLEGRLRKDY